MKITKQMLETLVDEINSITGQPSTPWTTSRSAHIGNYHLNYHLNYYLNSMSLRQMISKSGVVGAKDILIASSKRELFDLMSAFIQGLNTASLDREPESTLDEYERKAL